MQIKGVIFDMDGLLLDTEKLYNRFWIEAAQFYGYPMTKEHALSIRSLGRTDATAKLRGYFGDSFEYQPVYEKRVELMDKFIDEHGVEPKKGAQELLNHLKENGYKIALATSSPYDRVSEQLGSVGLLEYFDAISCRSMVKRGKPAPDIYLFAAEKLGLAPAECIALEDSPTGIRSAYAAGCKAVMVPDLDKPDSDIKEQLYACCDDLAQVIDLLN